MLLCRGDEPEPLKRLKREMGVALHEEDYVAAGTQIGPRLLFALQGFTGWRLPRSVTLSCAARPSSTTRELCGAPAHITDRTLVCIRTRVRMLTCILDCWRYKLEHTSTVMLSTSSEVPCGSAARIRDHPFMRMHMRILEHRRNKREEAAKTMEQELEQITS